MTITDAPVDPRDIIDADEPEPAEAVEPGGAGGGDGGDAGEAHTPTSTAVAVALPTVAAAIMVGGIFTGPGGRVYAAVAGLLGVALAVVASRIRRPTAGYAVIVVGLFALGLAMLTPSGLHSILDVRVLVARATSSGSALRPPLPLRPGWQAVLGWIMGTAGFLAGWVALTLRRPSLGVLLPLPLAAVAGISVPHSAQAASGVAVLVLFAASLGVLSAGSALGDGGARLPAGYQARRAARSVPLVAVVCGVLVALLRANFLFPHPVFDPAQEAQRPRAVPLSAVEDRVLFSVKSTVSGPWRIGSLDVYDGHDWRLPPFAESKLKAVPKSGIVDPDLSQSVKAEFTIAGLSGAVLPGLPNTVGISAIGPRLAYDARNGNIRTAEGEVHAGLRYTVVAAALPTVQDLDLITAALPKEVLPFTQIGPPPPAVADLIAKAPTTSKWQQFDFVRTYVLDNVTATGSGVPKSIDAARVQDMLAGSKEGSPFEIVAAQAMLARWVGLPSRIGYGFDGGEQVGDELRVHPKDGATFVEVYFPGYKWLPVIGTPKRAKATASSHGPKKTDPSVLPSDDISIQVYAFQATPPTSLTLARLRQVAALIVLVALLIGAVYLLWPLAAKALVRRRRRRAAERAGPVSRIALAYVEWRDLAADFGEAHASDTPFAFLAHFTPDEEHRQFAWLVTRALWGDLQGQVTDELAVAAETLSRSLQRRFRRQHAATLRVVAALSRRSLREPFAVPGAEAEEAGRAA